MAWIRIIDEDEADGLLTRIYDGARKRAGRVFNILKIQSQSPAALQSMIQLYQAASLADSPLTRAQKEMIAVVVSKSNNCHY